MNKDKKDWLIVGSGLAGSVFARQMADHDKKVLVIDRRSKIGGNCSTEIKDGIPIHTWGAHIFHTNSKEVWDWISQWTDWHKYNHQVQIKWGDRFYTFPICLKTLNEIDPNIKTPQQATDYFNQFKDLKWHSEYGDLTIDNLETHSIKQIGPQLYEIFIKSYTQKQWGVEPKFLPSRIIKRIPVRTNFDTTYFHNADWCAIPVRGYSEIFEKCLDHPNIEIITNVNYLDDIEGWDSRANRTLYTGPLDEYFSWDNGHLEWRSLDLVQERLDIPDFQGMSVINWPEKDVKWTRIIEHKHFINKKSDSTWITKEYPKNWQPGLEPFYPISDEKNLALHKQYKERFLKLGKLTCGRLADYAYYDMDQVIGSSLNLSNKVLSNEI